MPRQIPPRPIAAAAEPAPEQNFYINYRNFARAEYRGEPIPAQKKGTYIKNKKMDKLALLYHPTSHEPVLELDDGKIVLSQNFKADEAVQILIDSFNSLLPENKKEAINIRNTLTYTYQAFKMFYNEDPIDQKLIDKVTNSCYEIFKDRE